MKYPLSVSIISYNEEERIAKTIESVLDIAQEIIVVDSYSTDNTKQIAENLGCKVFLEEWKGFTKQKNSSLIKCTKEWILCLDCDEIVTKELKQSIINAITANNNQSYLINRKTYYQKKILNYAWQPDKKLRFVRKSSNPRWEGLDVHENLVSDFKISELNGDLIHYSYKSIEHHFAKTIDYARLSAESYLKKGKKVSFCNLVINPIYAFLNLYIINQGFRDGFRGLIAAFSSMTGTFLKYAIMFELRLKEKNESIKS